MLLIVRLMTLRSVSVCAQAVIEVLTAGTVSAVLLLLMICCIWKICWIRWQRQGLVGPGSEQSNGLDAYVELISNNGMVSLHYATPANATCRMNSNNREVPCEMTCWR